MKYLVSTLASAVTLLIMTGGPLAQDYSPYAQRTYPIRVFWGDTHLHTNYSNDAAGFGATVGPEDAYRLARGQQITASLGEPLQLSRPLDWLVISDHAEDLDDPSLIGNPRPRWEDYLEIAEQYNDPSVFTAMIGYEWSARPNGAVLHRNVLYRDSARLARRTLPFRSDQSTNPEDLWSWMDTYETVTGGSVLALAHNGNWSDGLMFPDTTNPATGGPLTATYAANRARWEPLYEVTQMKGDGEAHSDLSPGDAFADYETVEAGSNVGNFPFEYARPALKNGLLLEGTLGTNPYKFGMVGSTDSHTGLTTADENNYFGKTSEIEPRINRWSYTVGFVGGTPLIGWETVASGYAGVWATANTRAALFDAMMRREVYATTGPRINLRFFGGWNFVAGDELLPDTAAVGYAKGVPMGGDLTNAPANVAPSFLVSARRDSYSGNLDRIQIVKGWVDALGAKQEQVFDAACSDGRAIDASHHCVTPVGDTVDVPNATWTNTIGDPKITVLWVDPQFDATQRAFYYARVIEIPTPRWTAYDAKHFNVAMPNVPMSGQERAYSSPIWFTP